MGMASRPSTTWRELSWLFFCCADLGPPFRSRSKSKTEERLACSLWAAFRFASLLAGGGFLLAVASDFLVTVLALVFGGVVLLLFAVVLIFVVFLVLEGVDLRFPAVVDLFAVVPLGLGGVDFRLPAGGVLAGTTLAGFVVGKTFLPELLCCSADLLKPPSEVFLLVCFTRGASDPNAFLRLLPPARSALAASAL